jgi:hypothetical protein
LCYISRTGNEAFFTLDVDIFGFEHLQQKIYVSVACCFGTNERSAEFLAFPRECSGEFARKFFVFAEHVTYFATADADITCRYVHIWPNYFPQTFYKRLAESHDFAIRFTAWRKV